MPKAGCADADFVRLIETVGIIKASQKLGVSERAVYKRRANVEKKLGRQITTPPYHNNTTRRNVAHPQRIDIEIDDGVILVASDCHYWPGDPSTAHRAFVKFCKILKPAVVVMNGDVMDCGSISRFPPIGWESQPTVAEEIGAAQRRLREITEATPQAEHAWTLGNHDGRFETRLATVAPEFAGVHGVHLKDHFPDWKACWSVWVNDGSVIKHRFKGGIHAAHNNTLWSGRTLVTGHLHSLKVTPHTDYNGTRFGVDTGTLADVYGKQFTDYTEDNPRSWRSGFAVLTFDKGRLLWPEVVHVMGDKEVEFRGKVYAV